MATTKPSEFWARAESVSTSRYVVDIIPCATNHGFYAKLSNGWTVSIQYGTGNYCGAYHGRPDDESEVAAWDAAGRWHNFGAYDADNVLGWQSVAQVGEFIELIGGM
jgi:hypothetical protein